MRPRTYVACFLFAAATLAWTPAGQTSDPVLAAAELPLEVWRDCSAVAGCLGGGIESRWVGRASAAGGSDLFLVRHTDCPSPAATDCRVYLIEKAPGAARDCCSPSTVSSICAMPPPAVIPRSRSAARSIVCAVVSNVTSGAMGATCVPPHAWFSGSVARTVARSPTAAPPPSGRCAPGRSAGRSKSGASWTASPGSENRPPPRARRTALPCPVFV